MIREEIFSKSKVTVFQKSKENKEICGDSYLTIEMNDFLLLAIADGLGSGEFAQLASKKAVESIKQNLNIDVTEMLLQLNEELRGTRGAVVGILKLSYLPKEITYVGVGNIQMVIIGEEDDYIRPFSKPGYMSGKPIKVKEKKFPMKDADKIVLFSDGVQLKKEELRKIKYANEDYAHLLEDITKEHKDDITVIIAERHMI